MTPGQNVYQAHWVQLRDRIRATTQQDWDRVWTMHAHCVPVPRLHLHNETNMQWDWNTMWLICHGSDTPDWYTTELVCNGTAPLVTPHSGVHNIMELCSLIQLVVFKWHDMENGRGRSTLDLKKKREKNQQSSNQLNLINNFHSLCILPYHCGLFHHGKLRKSVVIAQV